MSIQLFAYIMRTYKSVQDILDRKGKTAVIHLTGTGKRFIAFKWIEDRASCDLFGFYLMIIAIKHNWRMLSDQRCVFRKIRSRF